MARLTTEDLKFNGTLTKLRGTYSYCAPEVYNGETFTAASDIFSVGVIIWEIITRIVSGKYCRPYSEFKELQFDFQIIVQTSRGKRCTIHPKTPPGFVSLISRCWHAEALKRPTSSEVIAEIHALQQLFNANRADWIQKYTLIPVNK